MEREEPSEEGKKECTAMDRWFQQCETEVVRLNEKSKGSWGNGGNMGSYS